MERFIRKLFLAMLLLSATHVHAESSFIVSPSLGGASISNIDGYNNSPFLRVDGSFYPLPQLGVNVFVAHYPSFDSSGGASKVNIRVNGYGAGVTGRWPVHPHMQPFVRLDYMRWDAKATGIGRTLAKDKGGSAGFAVGMQFPIKRVFGIKAEVAGYNNVSGADIRQFSLGLVFEF